MSNKCSFVLSNGRPCKRWANRGAGFCDVHKSDPAPRPYNWKEQNGPDRHSELDVSVPALARLATARDLFDVIRESINAVRLGRMSPGQAYAICALAAAWTNARKELGLEDRTRILRGQMLPALTEEERLAEEAEDLQGEDLGDDRRAEADDLAERGDPVARDGKPLTTHGYLMLRISGWVASRVCVNT